MGRNYTQLRVLAGSLSSIDHSNFSRSSHPVPFPKRSTVFFSNCFLAMAVLGLRVPPVPAVASKTPTPPLLIPHRQATHALWYRQHHHIACIHALSHHSITNPARRLRLAAVPAAAAGSSSAKPDFDLAVYLDAAAQPQHFVGPVAVANIPGATGLLCICTPPASSQRTHLSCCWHCCRCCCAHRQGPWPGRHCAAVCWSAAAGGAAPGSVGGRPRGDSRWVVTRSRQQDMCSNVLPT